MSIRSNNTNDNGNNGNKLDWEYFVEILRRRQQQEVHRLQQHRRLQVQGRARQAGSMRSSSSLGGNGYGNNGRTTGTRSNAQFQQRQHDENLLQPQHQVHRRQQQQQQQQQQLQELFGQLPGQGRVQQQQQQQQQHNLPQPTWLLEFQQQVDAQRRWLRQFLLQQQEELRRQGIDVGTTTTTAAATGGDLGVGAGLGLGGLRDLNVGGGGGLGNGNGSGSSGLYRHRPQQQPQPRPQHPRRPSSSSETSVDTAAALVGLRGGRNGSNSRTADSSSNTAVNGSSVGLGLGGMNSRNNNNTSSGSGSNNSIGSVSASSTVAVAGGVRGGGNHSSRIMYNSHLGSEQIGTEEDDDEEEDYGDDDDDDDDDDGSGLYIPLFSRTWQFPSMLSSPFSSQERPPQQQQQQQQHVPTVVDEAVLRYMPVCCITQEAIRRPVIAADGHTYEYDSIVEWFQRSSAQSTYQPCRSPMTNLPLSHQHLVPNYAVIEMSERAAAKDREDEAVAAVAEPASAVSTHRKPDGSGRGDIRQQDAGIWATSTTRNWTTTTTTTPVSTSSAHTTEEENLPQNPGGDEGHSRDNMTELRDSNRRVNRLVLCFMIVFITTMTELVHKPFLSFEFLAGALPVIFAVFGLVFV